MRTATTLRVALDALHRIRGLPAPAPDLRQIESVLEHGEQPVGHVRRRSHSLVQALDVREIHGFRPELGFRIFNDAALAQVNPAAAGLRTMFSDRENAQEWAEAFRMQADALRTQGRYNGDGLPVEEDFAHATGELIAQIAPSGVAIATGGGAYMNAETRGLLAGKAVTVCVWIIYVSRV